MDSGFIRGVPAIIHPSAESVALAYLPRYLDFPRFQEWRGSKSSRRATCATVVRLIVAISDRHPDAASCIRNTSEASKMRRIKQESHPLHVRTIKDGVFGEIASDGGVKGGE